MPDFAKLEATLTSEDRALAAFFEARMSDIADGIVSDLVARVLADDAEKDQLIADLVAAVSWYQASPSKTPPDQAAVGRGLRYAREHRA